MVDEGFAAATVARSYGIGTTTVAEWVKRYRAGGPDALMARVPPPPRRREGADPRRQAIAARQAHPEHGTRRIRDELTRFEALRIAETMVRRILHEAGLRAGRAESAVGSSPILAG
jgi:transposase